MSFGSAAALRVPTAQAALSPAQTAGSASPYTALPRPLGASPPIRRLPLLAGAGLPPRGRVLVVENDAIAALELQELLLEGGYLVIGPVESAMDAQELIERTPIHRPIDCALLSAAAGDAAQIADILRRREIPVAWVVQGETPVPADDAPIMRRPVDRETLLRTIRQALGRAHRPHLYATKPPQEAWPRLFPQL